MQEQAKLLAKVGWSMLITLAFFTLLLMLAPRIGWLGMALILVVMALVLRWNLARIDASYRRPDDDPPD